MVHHNNLHSSLRTDPLYMDIRSLTLILIFLFHMSFCRFLLQDLEGINQILDDKVKTAEDKVNKLQVRY